MPAEAETKLIAELNRLSTFHQFMIFFLLGFDPKIAEEFNLTPEGEEIDPATLQYAKILSQEHLNGYFEVGYDEINLSAALE